MGHWVSNMIGIRTGGVFSADLTEEEHKKLVDEIRATFDEMEKDDAYVPSYVEEDMLYKYSITKEVCGGKGSYVLIGGIFNFWSWPAVSDFATRLSKKVGYVFAACWDEDSEKLNCQVFHDGKPRFNATEAFEFMP